MFSCFKISRSRTTSLSNRNVNQNLSNGLTLLHVAAGLGENGLVSSLIASKVQLGVVDKDGDTALSLATMKSHGSTMELLLAAGAEVNVVNTNYGRSPLHYAILAGYLQGVQILQRYNCSVNIQDSDGNTPLHIGIAMTTSANVESINLLINSTDLSIVNKAGFNILHTAAIGGNTSVIRRVLAKSGNLVYVKKSNDGYSPLHISVGARHFNASKILIEECCAEINARTNKKQTPLHLAVTEFHYNLVEYLVGHGASVGLQDEDGDTPLHMLLFAQTMIESFSGLSQLREAVSRSDAELRPTALKLYKIASDLKSSGNGWENMSNLNLGIAAIACFLVLNGADLSQRNRVGLTPLQLTQTNMLREKLLYYQKLLQDSKTAQKNNESLSEAAGVGSISASMTTAQNSAVPMPTSTTSGLQQQSSSSHNNNEFNSNNCAICMESRKDTAFSCGHSACQQCATSLTNCHICRGPIYSKLHLY